MVYVVGVLYHRACIYGHDGHGDFRGDPKGGIYGGDHGNRGHNGLGGRRGRHRHGAVGLDHVVAVVVW